MKQLQTNERYALRFFVLIGILITVLMSASILFGFAETALLPTAISAAILAAVVGLFNIWRNHTGGLFKDDPFYMMQLLFYIGLLVFSVGEASIAASVILSDDVLIGYLPSTSRMFGMIFWLLGVLNYVRATNHVLEYTDIKLWVVLIIVCSISVIAIVSGINSKPANPSLITIINLMIFALGTGIMTCFMFYLLWIFRNGEFRDMLLLIFSCLLLVFIRSIVIAYSIDVLMDLVSLVLALEAYLCLWASESMFFKLLYT